MITEYPNRETDAEKALCLTQAAYVCTQFFIALSQVVATSQVLHTLSSHRVSPVREKSTVNVVKKARLSHPDGEQGTEGAQDEC